MAERASKAGPPDAAIALAVTVACLALYLATLTPGLSYLEGDGHELTVAAATLGVAHPSGYPLYTWLAHLFTRLPVGEVAYRTNLLSSVAGAAAVGTLFLLGRAAGLSRGPAVFAALLFGVSNTFWSQAVITEVYAPNALAMLATMLLLVRGHLVGAALALGLSLGTHMTNLTYAPVYALFVLVQAPGVLRRPALLAGVAAAFLVGTAQFAWLPLRAHVIDLFPSRSPDTWEGFFSYTMGAMQHSRAKPLATQPAQLAFYGDELVQSFTWAAVALGVPGMWRLAWQAPRAFWLFGGVFALNVASSLQLRILDVDVLLIPSHAMFALFAGFGVAGAYGAASWLAPPRARVARIAATAALTGLLVVLGAANFVRNDRSGDTVVRDFQRAVFAGVPAGSQIVAGRGAFGRDMVYARLFDEASRDFVLASVDRPRVRTARRPLYLKTRLITGALDSRRWALARSAMPRNPWTVARIVGGRSGMLLYRVTRQAPNLLVQRMDAGTAVDPAVGGPLRGHHVEPRATADRRLRLTTYWTKHERQAPIVTLRIGGELLTAYEVGHGNWRRIRGAAEPAGTPLFVERLDVVVPSGLPAGPHALDLGIVELARNGPSVRWIPLGVVSLG